MQDVASTAPPGPSRGGTARLVRCAVEAEGVTAGAVLRQSPGRPRGFWQRADEWAAWSGAVLRLGGDGDEASDLRTLARRARDLLGGLDDASSVVAAPAGDGATPATDPPRARFYGGGSFSGASADGPWAAFGRRAFVLPRLEVRRTVDGTWMIGVSGVRSGQTPAAARRELGRRLVELRDRLRGADAPAEGAVAEGTKGGSVSDFGDATLVARPTPPLDRRRWNEIVERALEEIRADRLDKVVLARPLDVEVRRPVDPVALLLRLRADHPASFPYLIDPGTGPIFVGAAPEIVAAVDGDRFQATVVAGTCPRGHSDEEDEALARELLKSAKDQEEHALVLRDLRERLSALAPEVEADAEPTVLRLRELQHLRTEVTAALPGESHVLEVLERLHPTAAVNGFPRDAARAFLRRHEPFERGWYAGPVGWFDAGGNGVFAVALRCGLIQGRRLRLYAGAGVVADSEPAREWDETTLKFRPVLDALRDLAGADGVREGVDASGHSRNGSRSAPGAERDRADRVEAGERSQGPADGG